MKVIPWAMMLGLIGLGLLYLGMPGPGLTEVCTMPAGMSCPKSDLSSSSDLLNVTLVNGLKKNIVITNISCSKDSMQSEPCDSNRCAGFSGDGVTVPLGGSFNALVTCNDDKGKAMTIDQGDAYSGRINLEYYFQDEGSRAMRKIRGNLYIKAS